MTSAFKIRQDQLDAFFFHDLLEHVRHCLPDQYQALGENGTMQAVQYGASRARTHGIVSNPGMRAYVQVMFVLGPDFDTDPKLPWVRPALAQPTELERIRTLVAGTETHLRQTIAGMNGMLS